MRNYKNQTRAAATGNVRRRKANFYIIVGAVACWLSALGAAAQDVYADRRAGWMQRAEEAKPQLHETVVRPVAIVQAVPDGNAYQGWRYEPVQVAAWEGEPKAGTKTDEEAGADKILEQLYSANFKEVKSVTLDFGRHLTGYFTFHTRTLNRCQDAPVRLKFTFGETPAELNTPLDPWPGSLSRAWMQDETVTVTQTDEYMTLPRRMAFRYLRIELLGASPDFDFAVDELLFRAVSSAGEVQTRLLPDCPQEMGDICRVGIATLGECMQTVYEDGPKRDRRLWLGDLYLESLANRYSFRNFALTRRCLYLFAALAAPDGIVISNLFERPEPHPQHGSYCLTYSLLFNSTLLEYLKDTGDRATADDLWPVARRQMEAALAYVNAEGLFDRSLCSSVWLFFDWRDGLDPDTPMQGAVLFALDQTLELARMLRREKETATWKRIASRMRTAARKRLYDRRQGVFVSGPQHQVSLLAQVWMVIGGVTTPEEGRQVLRTALDSSDTLMPGTPYATHYLIEAMLRCGMTGEARRYLTDYWGGMVRKGADTFWEAYDPQDDFISPYGFFPVNSACHAWSCTPVYFIHKYPEVFQR